MDGSNIESECQIIRVHTLIMKRCKNHKLITDEGEDLVLGPVPSIVRTDLRTGSQTGSRTVGPHLLLSSWLDSLVLLLLAPGTTWSLLFGSLFHGEVEDGPGRRRL